MNKKIISFALIAGIIIMIGYIASGYIPSGSTTTRTYTIMGNQYKKPLTLDCWILGSTGNGGEGSFLGEIKISNDPLFSFPDFYFHLPWGGGFKVVGTLTDQNGKTYEKTVDISEKTDVFTLTFHNIPYLENGVNTISIICYEIDTIGMVNIGERITSSISMSFDRYGGITTITASDCII